MPKTGTAKLSKCAPKQKAGTVLPFSSAACYVTLQRESEIACICVGDFVYFVVNKLSFFAGPCPFLSFACTHSYYAYQKTKCIQNVLEVQNIL